MSQDREHIRLLAMFHCVVAGLAALFALFPLIHLVFGIALVSGRFPEKQNPEITEWMGWFFILFSSVIILLGFAFAICLALAGRYLSQHRHYRYCLARIIHEK